MKKKVSKKKPQPCTLADEYYFLVYDSPGEKDHISFVYRDVKDVKKFLGEIAHDPDKYIVFHARLDDVTRCKFTVNVSLECVDD